MVTGTRTSTEIDLAPDFDLTAVECDDGELDGHRSAWWNRLMVDNDCAVCAIPTIIGGTP
jgi:hypothetical protein